MNPVTAAKGAMRRNSNALLLVLCLGQFMTILDVSIVNVALPDIPVALDGASLLELYPLAPLAAGHALSIAVTPYRDTIHVGVQANHDAVGDLAKLSDALPHAVAELVDL